MQKILISILFIILASCSSAIEVKNQNEKIKNLEEVLSRSISSDKKVTQAKDKKTGIKK